MWEREVANEEELGDGTLEALRGDGLGLDGHWPYARLQKLETGAQIYPLNHCTAPTSTNLMSIIDYRLSIIDYLTLLS